MIQIEKLYIGTDNSDGFHDKIYIKIGANTTGYTLDTNIYYQNIVTYESGTYKTIALGNADANGIYTINSTDLDIDEKKNIYGLHFFTFKEINDTDPNDIKEQLGIVANLIPYHECILDKVLTSNIGSCDIDNNNKNKKYSESINYIYSLIISLKECIRGKYINNAIKIIKGLNSNCSTCISCYEYKDIDFTSGMGFRTVYNQDGNNTNNYVDVWQ